MSKHILGFDNNSRRYYDKCNKTINENSSEKASMYSFTPPIYGNSSEIKNLSLSQPNIHVNQGNGWAGQNGKQVDIDSGFRNAKNLTNTREIHQFNKEQYFNVPYLARGPGNPCVESILRPGENISRSKPCNSFARDDMIERRFHPMVSSLRNIQDPSHIIPEHVNSNWKRGGQSSREMLRNPANLTKMGYQYNGKYWQKNK